MMRLTCLSFLFILIQAFVYAQPVCEVAIHVAVDGVDEGSCGSLETPCATINYGINRAQTEGLSDVRVGLGVYNEVVVLADGINLWGGFNPVSGWTKNTNDRSNISGGFFNPDNQWMALKIQNVTALTIVSDFIIQGPDVADTGLSSYAVHVLNSTNVHIQNCDILGGQGGDGGNGNPGMSATQVKAPSGLDGEAGESFSDNCNTVREPGGAGGVNPLTLDQNRGGNGGEGGSMDTSCGALFCSNCDATPGGAGTDGNGNSGFMVGDGGQGGGLCSSGSNGRTGMTEHGDGGTRSANNGLLSANFWLANTAGAGALGAHGGGGGGGGGAGGCDSGIDDKGASGGGGGAGGARAPVAGQGGQHGGSSFGVFAINSSLGLQSVDLADGQGGDGGNGGNGGLGQPGGDGGNGGTTGSSESGPAGNGGAGGDGGNSGAGAGGNGGSVIHIFSSNSTIVRDQTTIDVNFSSGGNLGVGGTAPVAASSGQNGLAGSILPTQGDLILNAALDIYEPPCQFQFLPLAQLAYCAGDEVQLSWQTTTTIDFLNIFLSLDGGSNYELIAENVLQDLGTYTHTFSAALPSSDQAVIRLADAALSEQEVTSSPFTINALKMTTVDAEICAGETYTFGSQTLSDSGTYLELFTSSSGCDSTVTLNLTVLPELTETLNEEICESETYTFGGQDYNVTGTYMATFTASNGCDSTVTLNLTVLPELAETINEEICDGEVYPFNGQELSVGGVYMGTFTGSNGCDSVVTLNLTVLEVFPAWDLEGDISPGTYFATGLITANGIIAAEEEVNLIAEGGILLTNGFHAQPGSILSARIGTCSPAEAKEILPPDIESQEVLLTSREHMHLTAFPNPFRDEFSISFELSQASEVEIHLQGLAGGIKRQLFSPVRLEPGRHEMRWVTTDLPAGMYLLRLRSGRALKSIKLVSTR